MKKIICTVTNDLNFDQRMIRICTSLANAGYQILLLGRELPDSPPLLDKPYKQRRFKLLFKKGKLFYIEFNVRLFFFLLFNSFDVVCSVDLDTLLPGFVISKIKRKKCIYDAHEYFTEVPEVVERPLVKGLWEALANFVIPKIKYAYTVSETIADEFYKKYQTRFKVVRNVPYLKVGINEKNKEKQKIIKRSKKNNTPFILIYQGVLNEGRGLEEMILAMKNLDKVGLWLVGEGDLSLQLRDLVLKNNLENKVVFYGKVSPGLLHELTCKAHLGLNLLENKGLNYYFSLANKTFDYMQAGIPSLCMNFPEYEKINANYSAFYLLENIKINTIKAAVEKFKTDEKYYSEMCENAFLAARQFYWEKEEGKLLEFFNSVFA